MIKLFTTHCLYISLCIALYLPAKAQHKFFSVNELFGISARGLNSVCYDNQGFIWSSSRFGILRVTHSDYRIYKLPFVNNNVIIVKILFENNKLVAYTSNGQVFLFNAIADKFELLVNLRDTIQEQYLSLLGVFVQQDGSFCFVTSAQVYRFCEGKTELKFKNSAEIESVLRFHEHQLLLGRSDGLWLADLSTGDISVIARFSELESFTITSLYVDSKQERIWVGTLSNGLFVYEIPTKHWKLILQDKFPKQPILAIVQNKDGDLLVGVDGQGVWKLSSSGTEIHDVFKENIDDPNSLKGNGVYGICCTPNGRVWICTVGGGLSFFDTSPAQITEIQHRANNNNSLVNNNVNRILEDKQGKLWFATNNGISCFNPETNLWRHFLNNSQSQSAVFLSICEDDLGRIWVGSYSNGVYLLDSETGKELAHYRHDSGTLRVSDFVFAIHKDTCGDIWIGGLKGEIVCCKIKENQFITYPIEPVISMADLSADEILLGCSYGLALLHKQSGKIDKLLVGFSVSEILVMDQSVWICTGGEGLIHYNLKTKETQKYTQQNGLASNFLSSIVAVDDHLWLGSENGFSRLNRQDKSCVNFPSIFALSSASFNLGAHLRLRNGEFIWGTNTGALRFSPDSIRENESGGNIFFQDIKILGRSIRDSDFLLPAMPIDSIESLRLDYFQNNVSFELIPLQNASGGKLSWKMEGFEKNWSIPSSNRMPSYTNLPSGHYTFKVRLYDGSLSRLLSQREISIEIVPPIWGTVWFWFGVLFFVTSLLLFLLKYYIKTLKQKHAEEKIRFFTNMAHDIRSSLTLIKAPLDELSREKNLSETGGYYLQLAKNQSSKLAAVVTQLLDFQKADIHKESMSFSQIDIVGFISNRLLMFESFAKLGGNEISFSSNLPYYLSAIDEAKMEKIVDNLISNAIKYSPKNCSITIQLICEPALWKLRVHDRGIGISKKAQKQLFKEFYRGENAVNSKVVGSGIGLLLVKNYVNLHNGKVSFCSNENQGSTFEIEIPFLMCKTGVRQNRNTQIDILEPNDHIKGIWPESHTDDLQYKERKGMQVLIVEDNNDLLGFLKSALKSEFQVLVAENGKLAWDMILVNQPDLVVSDVMMPEMNGSELCLKMKSSDETAHIPIILLTALSESADVLRGLGLGADEYLTKPFDMRLLIQRMKSIVKNRELVRYRALKMIKGDSSEPLLLNNINDKFMKKLFDVVRENISNVAFNKDHFAAAMNVSSSLLYKKMKSLTNLSPSDFVKNVRLEHAFELLQTKAYSVTEVSELCGFSSVSYFSTVFKKHYGKSPTDILK